MDGKQYIERQLASARRVFDGVVGDLTDEQLSWKPAGTANPIGATLLHVFGGEDMFIHTMLQHRLQLWDSEGWTSRVGVAMPKRGVDWEEASTKQLSVESLLAYGRAVRAATEAYLASLTAADLDRSILMFGNERTVADAFTTLIVHSTHHVGEISALKGIQGAKGLPY